MELLKKGSKGGEVTALQNRLNALGFDCGKADGVFGANTEKAVIAFQKAHGLTADGIVGEKTYAVLFPDEKADIEITKGYINTHISHLPNRQIKYIAVHYTAGGSSKAGSAMATRNVFLKRDASADFVVDDDTIVQINPDLRNYYTWNCGDKKNIYTGGGKLYGKATNRNTIGIEICSNLKSGTSASAANHAGWYYTEASLNNTLKLIRYLMKKYNIPKENVVRHYDISGKMCPGIFGYNDAYIYTTDGKQTKNRNNSNEWALFKARI